MLIYPNKVTNNAMLITFLGENGMLITFSAP
jgi:hypothetical protein